MIPLVSSNAIRTERPPNQNLSFMFSLLCVLSQTSNDVFLLKPLETKLISETSSVCQAEQVARVIVKDAIVSKLFLQV